MRFTVNAVLGFACLGLALVAGGCSRAHLTDTHGRAYHEAFAIQDANPNRKTTKSVNGLDSQEASVIAGSYRKSLAAKQESAATGPQLLMISPNRGGGGGGAVDLAPSVPAPDPPVPMSSIASTPVAATAAAAATTSPFTGDASSSSTRASFARSSAMPSSLACPRRA